MRITTTKEPNFQEYLVESLAEAIKKSATDVYDKAIKQVVADMEADRDRVLTNAVMRISNWVNFQDMGHTLRIEIQKPAEEHPNDK